MHSKSTFFFLLLNFIFALGLYVALFYVHYSKHGINERGFYLVTKYTFWVYLTVLASNIPIIYLLCKNKQVHIYFKVIYFIGFSGIGMIGLIVLGICHTISHQGKGFGAEPLGVEHDKFLPYP